MSEIWSGLPEVLQYHGPVVCPGLDITLHGGSDVAEGQVSRAPQNDTLGCVPVPSCPAGFLIVSLERPRWPPMQHLPNVRLVYAHSEGTGRDNDVHLIGEESPQHAPADARAEAGVIGGRANARAQQRARDQLRQPSRGRVDQGRTGGVADALEDQGEALAIVA